MDGVTAAAAAVTALATVVLVGITAYYARQTRETVRELRAARLAAEDTRRREKSEAHAEQALRGLQRMSDLLTLTRAADLPTREVGDLSRLLSAEASLIADAEVSDHVSACAKVAFTASWGDDALRAEGVSRAMANLTLGHIVGVTRSVVVSYLRGEQPGPWDWNGMPTAAEAQTWLLEKAKASTTDP